MKMIVIDQATQQPDAEYLDHERVESASKQSLLGNLEGGITHKARDTNKVLV